MTGLLARGRLKTVSTKSVAARHSNLQSSSLLDKGDPATAAAVIYVGPRRFNLSDRTIRHSDSRDWTIAACNCACGIHPASEHLHFDDPSARHMHAELGIGERAYETAAQGQGAKLDRPIPNSDALKAVDHYTGDLRSRCERGQEEGKSEFDAAIS